MTAPLFCLLSVLQQSVATNTHQIHTPPPRSSSPDFPTVPSLPVTSNLPRTATSVSPIVFGDREAELPAPPRSPSFTFVGHDEKVDGPSEFLRARRAGAGLDGRKPSTQRSRRRRRRRRPGDRTASACVALRMRTHLGTAPPRWRCSCLRCARQGSRRLR